MNLKIALIFLLFLSVSFSADYYIGTVNTTTNQTLFELTWSNVTNWSEINYSVWTGGAWVERDFAYLNNTGNTGWFLGNTSDIDGDTNAQVGVWASGGLENITMVVPFGDTFNDGIADATKFTYTAGSCGAYTESGGIVNLTSTGGTNCGLVGTKGVDFSKYMYVARSYTKQANAYVYNSGGHNTTANDWFMFGTGGGVQSTTSYVTAEEKYGATFVGAWHLLEMNLSATEGTTYIDNSLENTHTSQIPPVSMPVYIGVKNSGNEVSLDYVFFAEPNYDTASVNWALNGSAPAGTDTVNITLLAPADLYSSLNKTTNFTYQVNTTKATTCNFYRNSINEFNDTFSQGVLQNTTHIINQTYGLHNWSVYCEQDADATVNDTSATWDNEIYFNVTALLPDDGVLLIGNTTQFNYSTTNYYDIECNLTVDGSVEDNRTVSSSATIGKILNISSGSHTWSVTCFGADNLAYSKTTPTRSFDMNYNSYAYIVNLSTVHENIFAEPQAIFYDINGNLNVLYFTDETPDDQIRIRTINGTEVQANYSTALNQTKTFFIAFRNSANTSILTFGLDNTSAIFIDINGGTTVTETATAINAEGNEEFDPYTYAYTKHFTTIDYVTDSYYLFLLPTTGGTKVIKKNITSTTLEDQGTVTNNCDIVWGTIANNSNLTEWLYVAPKDHFGNNHIALYVYDGSSSTEITELGSNIYSQAEIEGMTVFFEEYDGATYILVVNATDGAIKEDRIYLIEEDETFEFGENLENPSHFFFIENDTFVFFDTQSGTTYAYSCYYNGSILDCIKFDATDYGATVPYERGAMTTAKRDSNNNDEVSKGIILANEVTQLLYNRNTYDTKFICYDEVAEFRKNFTVQIYTDTSSNILSSQAWGYVLPSDLFGTGTKKAYFLCSNGTNRLFVTGIANDFQIDSYSLNTWQGQYYTFLLEDKFGVPVQDATITAYRFSTDKQAWVIIEQAITDFSGSGILFLQQYSFYKIVIDDGSVVMNFDFVPATYTTVEVELAGNTTDPVLLPNYEYVWNDVSYYIEPENTYSSTPIEINYTVISNSSSLEYYGMKVIKTVNGSSSTVLNQNITTQATGGIINYTTQGNGTFYVYVWFKHQNYTEQKPFTKIYTISAKSGILQAKEDFEANSPISGWALYFLAVIVSALVGGYTYQYTEDGAGIAVIFTLAIFTWFMPDAEIVCLTEGACITAVHITVLTALAVLGAIFVRRSM